MLEYSGMEIKKLINKNWWAFFYLQMLIILLSYIHGGINFAKNPKKGFGAVRGFIGFGVKMRHREFLPDYLGNVCFPDCIFWLGRLWCMFRHLC